MTREEAINYFKRSIAIGDTDDERQHNEALKMAIKALEQEPCEDCISRQAVIDIVRFEEKWLFDAKSDNKDTTIAFGGIKSKVAQLPSATPKTETVTEFADRCRECGAKYGKLLEQTRWIPVSERMPAEEKKSYWICTDYGHQCECRWTNVSPFWTELTTDWHWHRADVPQYNKVVAWMPLPEPYKAESEDKE